MIFLARCPPYSHADWPACLTETATDPLQTSGKHEKHFMITYHSFISLPLTVRLGHPLRGSAGLNMVIPHNHRNCGNLGSFSHALPHLTLLVPLNRVCHIPLESS